MRPTWRQLAGHGVLFAAILLLPLVISDFRASQFAYVGVFAIALIGLSILTGYTGQISLGHGGFMAIGAYVTAILSVNYGVYDLLTVPLGGIAAGIVGFLFGFPALRLAGVYLALATFALAVIVPSLATALGDRTGGTAGILLELPTSPIGALSPDKWLYYVTWAIAIVLFAAATIFVRGRRGRALRAVRENEIAAVSAGVSLTRYKTLAFGVSAFYAGVAGSLYAILNFIVAPGTFPITLSILLLAGLVVGGAASFVGVLAGAAFVQFVPLYAGDVVGRLTGIGDRIGLPGGGFDPTTPGVPSVVYGVILLAVLWLAPRGAAGLAQRLGRILRIS
ncbi:MAG TPA: branched-chain amino acid ABC transporter permease [Gaiellaceae bacterium]|nr:branched-chain amino acid ABC transporter permease [Gaiellaceae bacterium]